uniref:Uncharacterized protein n=1 Tax=Equus asinus TaxID=9793 RepID=A0A9L0KE32_EQUAS
MYLLMNSLTVMSVWDHSSSVYLEPTSTGTVRQPATSWIYSKLSEKQVLSLSSFLVSLLGHSAKCALHWFPPIVTTSRGGLLSSPTALTRKLRHREVRLLTLLMPFSFADRSRKSGLLQFLLGSSSSLLANFSLCSPCH